MIKPKPTKEFAELYAMTTIMQHVALVECILQHRRMDAAEAANAKNTLVYTVGAEVAKAGWAKKNERKIPNNAIVVGYKDDYEIILYPKLAMNAENIPPATMLYIAWYHTTQMDRRPLSVVYAAKVKGKRAKGNNNLFDVLLTSVESHISTCELVDGEFKEIADHPDNEFTLALIGSSEVSKADRDKIYDLARDALLSFDHSIISEMMGRVKDAVEKFFEHLQEASHSMGDVLSKVVGEIRAGVSSGFDDISDVIEEIERAFGEDAIEFGEDDGVGVVAVNATGKTEEEMDEIFERVVRKIRASGGQVDRVDRKGHLPDELREAQNKLKKAFEKGDADE